MILNDSCYFKVSLSIILTNIRDGLSKQSDIRFTGLRSLSVISKALKRATYSVLLINMDMDIGM